MPGSTIAALLYDETAPEQLTTLRNRSSIEGPHLEHVSPRNPVFFYRHSKRDSSGAATSILGEITLTETRQGAPSKSHQLSPYGEKCCLLVSANASYGWTSWDMPDSDRNRETISEDIQQRLVHHDKHYRYLLKVVEKWALTVARFIRTPKGRDCRWQDYKAVNLHQHSHSGLLAGKWRAWTG